MTKLNISLPSIDDVKGFTSLMNNYDYEAEIVSGKYAVDAKSIMGLFSIDLGQPLELVIHSDNCGGLLEKLEKYITQTQ